MSKLPRTVLLLVAVLLLAACVSGSTRGRYFRVSFDDSAILRKETTAIAVNIAEAFKGYGFKESYASGYTPNKPGEFGRLILNASGRRAVIFFNLKSGNVVEISILADEPLLREKDFVELLNLVRASCEALAASGHAKWEYEEGGGSFIK